MAQNLCDRGCVLCESPRKRPTISGRLSAVCFASTTDLFSYVSRQITPILTTVARKIGAVSEHYILVGDRVWRAL